MNEYFNWKTEINCLINCLKTCLDFDCVPLHAQSIFVLSYKFIFLCLLNPRIHSQVDESKLKWFWVRGVPSFRRKGQKQMMHLRRSALRRLTKLNFNFNLSRNVPNGSWRQHWRIWWERQKVFFLSVRMFLKIIWFFLAKCEGKPCLTTYPENGIFVDWQFFSPERLRLRRISKVTFLNCFR